MQLTKTYRRVLQKYFPYDILKTMSSTKNEPESTVTGQHPPMTRSALENLTGIYARHCYFSNLSNQRRLTEEDLLEWRGVMLALQDAGIDPVLNPASSSAPLRPAAPASCDKPLEPSGRY
jgi:hypothetical protein